MSQAAGLYQILVNVEISTAERTKTLKAVADPTTNLRYFQRMGQPSPVKVVLS